MAHAAIRSDHIDNHFFARSASEAIATGHIFGYTNALMGDAYSGFGNMARAARFNSAGKAPGEIGLDRNTVYGYQAS